MKKFNQQLLWRWIFYFLGLLILSLGITLNTKSSLGVSPIVSVSYSFSEITHTNFGDMTFVWYAIMVVVEIILHLVRRVDHLKSELTKDLLQLPLSLLFTRFINFWGARVPVFQEAYPDSFLGSYIGRLCIIILAIALTGFGAAMSVKMRIIPNAGDGIVLGISDAWHKSLGFTKNCFDAFCILLTIAFSMITAGHVVGIGIGTLLTVIGVGRFVALYQITIHPMISKMAGVE